MKGGKVDQKKEKKIILRKQKMIDTGILEKGGELNMTRRDVSSSEK